MQKFLGGVVILLLIVGGVGFYLGWFNFEKKKDTGDDKVTFSVEVDKQKIKDDAAAAEKRAKEIGADLKEKASESTETARKKLNESAAQQTVAGRINRVDPASNRVTVMTADNKEMTFQVEPATTLRLQDASAVLKEFREGDRITVVYAVQDGKNIARSVSVERSE
jgi:Cu/Ag efflux protein CusF